MNNIEKLLGNVSVSVEDIDKQQRVSGELFNIFSITKMERSEVNTHSSMIAELLNPFGSHGQGDKFLILFLRILKPDDSFTGMQNSKVFKEKSFNRGRDRIDILVDLKDHVFLIENKIDAEDGNEQLKRYAEVGASFGKQWHLIYLTKFGSDAEEYSHHGVEYQRISYREDILAWLNSCIDEVNAMSTIKHALLQYQYLIKKITGTTMTNELTNEIVELLIDGNNLESANAISKAILPAKGKILYSFFQRLEVAIKKEFNFVSIVNSNFRELEYDEKKCVDWFRIGRKKSKNVGVFFDVGIPNVLFRVEVASEALHYGVMGVKKVGNGKYELIDFQNFEIQSSQCFEYRNWKKIKWFSVLYKDSISSDLDCLRNDKKFMEEVVRAIAELTSDFTTYDKT
ncbi:MAG: PDDEXK-like family protein [Methylobacter sp.]